MEERRKKFKFRKKATEPELIDGFSRAEVKRQLTTLTRRKEEMEKELAAMRQEKFDLVLREKRLYEEENCFYSKGSTQHGPWPILNNQYKVLSLLGKGGFSEVYKVFDFNNLRYAACKLHSINPKWDKATKDNYMRHTFREIVVFKNLSHPNIIE